VTSHWVSPFPTSRQPTARLEKGERTNRDEQREAGAEYLTSESERTAWDSKSGFVGARSPDGRDLALVRDEAAGDPRTQQMRDIYHGIKYGELKGAGLDSINVDGYTFTAEQLASLPEDDRNAIANRWIDAPRPNEPQGYRPMMDAYYAGREEQLARDKAFADAEGLSPYAKQYPGGVDRFVDDTAQVNPNYKTFVEGYAMVEGKKVFLPDLRVTNHAQWEAVVTQYDQAASVIAGVKDSRYGLDIDPKYAGIVAGISEPVGAWYLRDQEEQKAGGDSEFTAALRTNYDKYAEVGEALDTLDRQWGQPVGTNRAIFVNNVINGALDSADDYSYALPKDTHNALKAMGVSDYFESTSTLKQYFTWRSQQAGGAPSDIDAYNKSYWSKKNAEQVAGIALRLSTGQGQPGAPAQPYDAWGNLTPAAGGGVAVGVGSGLATVGQPTILAAEPGGGQGVSVPAGVPLATGEQRYGSDGSTWVYVQIPEAGIGGWVNVAELAPAA
jgi:hypothetical protein